MVTIPAANRLRTRHVIAGHINPHCVVCLKTPMQIQQQPTAPCERPNLLPFEFERPMPAKAELKATKERAS